MAPILSSEIARLVLGYLEESKCEQSYKSFLESNKDLKECLFLHRSGREIPTEFMGKSLIDILEEYVNIHSLVQNHIKKLKSDEQKDRCLPAVLPITASLLDQVRVLIDASSTSQTMLLSITLPANSNTSHSGKTKVRSVGLKPDKSSTKHKHLSILGETEDKNKKGHSSDNCGLLIDDSDVDMSTPVKHRNNIGLSHNSSKEDDEHNESAKVEMIAKAILEKPELQEKIAENINLIRNTPNEVVPATTSVVTSRVSEDMSDYGMLNPTNILDSELDIIKTIVEKTERDPVFEKFLDEIVGPVAEITSDENVNNCSLTSTPQRSRSIPRVQLNNRRRHSNVRSLPDIRKIHRNKIPLRDRLRSAKQKNLDNILSKSDEKQLNFKSIDDHNAAAIQSIINVGSQNNIPVSEGGCENQINPPPEIVTEQEVISQVFDSQQNIQKSSEKSNVTTSIDNVLEVQNKVFEEKTTNSTLNSLINDIFTPIQQAVPSTTNNGDVVLFEGSLDKYLQSSHILPPSYSTQSTTQTVPQKQMPPTGVILQQPTSLLLQQPTGGYFMLNHNIVSTQHPLLISQDAISANPVNTEITSPFYIVQNTSMLNYPSSNVLNFAVQQPKIEISVPKPQSLIKCQSVITTKTQEESSTITPQEIMEMPMIMCTEQEMIGSQEQNMEKPQDTSSSNGKTHNLLSVTDKNKKGFKRKLSRKNSRKLSKSFKRKSKSYIIKTLDSSGEKSKGELDSLDAAAKQLEQLLSKSEESTNVCDMVSMQPETSLPKKSSNEIQIAEHLTDSSCQSKSQTKRRIVPVLISSQTESVNRVFQECKEQMTLYSTSNLAETVIVDSNKNRLNLSESLECNKIKSKTPELIKASECMKAQSTPKSGGRSHIRALNFSTPPKSSESVNMPLSKDAQCRIKLFDRDSGTLKRFNDFSNKNFVNVPIATRSPMQKLKADWDRVQGVGLIFGIDNFTVKQNNIEITSRRKRSFSESDLITSSKNQTKVKGTKNDGSDVQKEFIDNKKKLLTSWDTDLRALVTSSPPKQKIKRVIHKKESVDSNSSIEFKKSRKGKQNVLNSSNENETSPVTRRITRSCTSPKKNIHTSKENSKVNTEVIKKKVTKKVVIKPRCKNKRASPEMDSKPVETVKSESTRKDLKSIFKIEEMEKIIRSSDEESIRNKNKPKNFKKKCNLSNCTGVTESSLPVVVFDKSQMKIELSTSNAKCVLNENTKNGIENLDITQSLPEILNKELVSAINTDKSQFSLSKTEQHFEKHQYNVEKASRCIEVSQQNVKIISDTNITPELSKQLTSFPITSAHNLIPLFETPIKEDFSGIPITPRFLSPFSTVDTPITKLLKEQTNIISESSIPTPSFPPMTPNIVLTPKLPDSENPSDYFNRGTDYSPCSSSYYQPSDNDQNALENILITECAKYERNEIREMNKSEEVIESSDIEKNSNNKDTKSVEEMNNKNVCNVEKTENAEEVIKKSDKIDVKDTDNLKEINEDGESINAKKKSEVEKTSSVKEVYESEEVRDIDKKIDNNKVCDIKKTAVSDTNRKEISNIEGTSDIKRVNRNKSTKKVRKSSGVKRIRNTKESGKVKEMNKIKVKEKVEEITNVKETSNIEKSVVNEELNDNESLVKETNKVTDLVKETNKVTDLVKETNKVIDLVKETNKVTDLVKETNKVTEVKDNVDKETEVIPYTLLEISLPERQFSKVLDKTKYESTSHFEDDNARDTDGNEMGGCVLKISGNLLKELTPTANDSAEIKSEINVSNKPKASFKNNDTSDSSFDSSSTTSAVFNSSTDTCDSDSDFSLSEGEDATVIHRDNNFNEGTSSFRYPLRDRINLKQTKDDSKEIVKSDEIVAGSECKDDDLTVENKGLLTIHKNSSKLSFENEVNAKQENKNLKVEVPQNFSSSHDSLNAQEGSLKGIESEKKLFSELREKRQQIIEKIQAYTTGGKKKHQEKDNISKKVETSRQSWKSQLRNKHGKFLPMKKNEPQKSELKITPSKQILSESTWKIVDNENVSFSKDHDFTETGSKSSHFLIESKDEKEIPFDNEGLLRTKVKSAPIVKKFIRSNKSISNETQESDSESTIALVTHLKERGILLVPNKKVRKPRLTFTKSKNVSGKLNKTETIRIKTKKPLKSSLYSSHGPNLNKNTKSPNIDCIKQKEAVTTHKQVSRNENNQDSNSKVKSLNRSDTNSSESKLNSQSISKNEVISKFKEKKLSDKHKTKTDDKREHKTKTGDKTEHKTTVDDEFFNRDPNKTLEKGIKLSISVESSTSHLELRESKLDNSKDSTTDDIQKVSSKDKKIEEPKMFSRPEKVAPRNELSCRDISDYISMVYDESQVKSKKTDTTSPLDLTIYEVELDFVNDEYDQDPAIRLTGSPLIQFLNVAPKGDNKKVKSIKVIRRRDILKRPDGCLKSIQKKEDNYHIGVQKKSENIQTFNKHISTPQNNEILNKQKMVENLLERKKNFDLDSLGVDSHKVTLETKEKRKSPLDILCAELSDNTNDTSFDSIINETTKVPLLSTSVYPENIPDSFMKFSSKYNSDKILKTPKTNKTSSEGKSSIQERKFHKDKMICKSNKERYNKDYKLKHSLQKYEEKHSSCSATKIALDKKQTDVELIEKLPVSKINDIVGKLNESLEERECSADVDDSLMTFAIIGEDCALDLSSSSKFLKKRKFSENEEININKRLKPNDPQTLLKKIDLDSFLRQVHGPDD